MPERIGHRAVWQLAGPLILSNVSVAILGMVDTAVVGHLGQPHFIGAVAVGGVIFSFLYWGMGFLRMGTTGIVAQLHGQHDHDEMRAAFSHTAGLALLTAFLLLLLQKPILAMALALIQGSVTVQGYAGEYFRWGIWGAPAVLLSMGMIGWFIGMQNARAPMYITIIINLLNILLDFIFVFGLDMDVRGVALASVVSQYLGATLGGYLVFIEFKKYPGRWRRHLVFNLAGWRRLLTLNRHIFVRTFCLMGAFAFFTSQGARNGDLYLAANAILMNLQALLALGLDGFANAAEALVGKAIGARNRGALKMALRLTGTWSLAMALGFSLFYWLLGPGLVDLITDIAPVRALAYEFLPWMVVSPVVSVWCFFLDGVFIGATRGKEMRDTMLIALALFIGLYLFVLKSLGNHGLWLAMMCFFAARGIGLGLIATRMDRHCQGFIVRDR